MDDGKIFIIGHARSGTTLLCDFLNTAKEVFILKEAELYWRSAVPAFPEYFNRRNEQLGFQWLKGHYIPPCVPREAPGSEILARLAEFYPRVGDKIALGPERPEQVKVWEYYATHHFRSTYIFMFRQPAAALVSMQRMFPEQSYAELLGAWLQAIELMIKFRSFLPHVLVVPVERISDGVLRNLIARLEIDAVVDAASLRPPQPLAAMPEFPGITPAELAQAQVCQKMYDEFCFGWDDESFGFNSRHDTFEYWRHYSDEVAAVATALDIAITEPYPWATNAATDPRRAVLGAYADISYLNTEWFTIAQNYVDDFPEDGYAHYIMALMLDAQHDYDAALRHFDEALRYGHDPFWVRYNRAQLQRKRGDISAALADIQTAVTLNARHAGACDLLAEITRDRDHAVPAK